MRDLVAGSTMSGIHKPMTGERARMSRENQIGIVDIFAGPGGLSEGFAFAGGRHLHPDDRPFRIALSIEKDPVAHRTLRLRSLVHELNDKEYRQYIEILNQHEPNEIEPHVREAFPDNWETACKVAQCLELSDETQGLTESLLDEVKENYKGRTGLIGGPPCQVYSLVGRSRNARNPSYQGDNDPRHTLYKQYIHALDYLRPAFFVMENVKGMLSSRHESQKIFPLVKRDLELNGAYRLFALAARSEAGMDFVPGLPPEDSRDFIVRMEDYRIPQKRHRLIILGIRSNFVEAFPASALEELRLLRDGHREEVTVDHTIGDLPKLRSGLSKTRDTERDWLRVVKDSLELLLGGDLDQRVRENLEELVLQIRSGELPRERSTVDLPTGLESNRIASALRVEGLTRLHHHETRGHMPSDIARYIFAAAFAEAHGHSPRPDDYPEALAPAHKNWNSGSFNDRFRVQVAGKPSSTIMSHISKDGHYYIHPDPAQARSLTVREAARLQTFPDDYIFLGNRTEQYHQVGNAVPPMLAGLIAELIVEALGE